jgi:hypothetical protein
MKKQLKKIVGQRVKLRKNKEVKEGLLCKSMYSSNDVDEWFVLSNTMSYKFIEQDISFIDISFAKKPMIVLKDQKLPDMNDE